VIKKVTTEKKEIKLRVFFDSDQFQRSRGYLVRNTTEKPASTTRFDKKKFSEGRDKKRN
jgi:hypothetical protein